jgi:hypothetical protein
MPITMAGVLKGTSAMVIANVMVQFMSDVMLDGMDKVPIA